MKKSFISISILIILFIGSLYLGQLEFSICTSILACLSLKEILYIRTSEKHVPIEIELLDYIAVVFFTMNNFESDLNYYLVDYRLIAALLLVNFIPLVLVHDKKVYNVIDALYLIGSTLFIGVTFNLITQFRSFNIDYVIYIFLLGFFNDFYGYVTGELIGTRPLLPSVSAKKSLEGSIGGLFMGTLIPSMYFVCCIPTDLPVYAVLIISFLLSILGQVGDLVFSFIKMEFGKKDFSKIVVGSGGILDVIDSIIFITLGFLLFLSVI